jgi:hypothetical protein
MSIIVGVELSRRVLAMLGVADGAGVTGSTVVGVAEEEAAEDRFFLRSASRFSM